MTKLLLLLIPITLLLWGCSTQPLQRPQWFIQYTNTWTYEEISNWPYAMWTIFKYTNSEAMCYIIINKYSWTKSMSCKFK